MDDELKKRLDPGYPRTGDRRKKRVYVSRDINSRMTESDKKKLIERNTRRKKDSSSKQKTIKPSRSMMMDTTTSAYGDAGRGRPVPEFSKGGICRGAGAAIKGTKFEGVF